MIKKNTDLGKVLHQEKGLRIREYKVTGFAICAGKHVYETYTTLDAAKREAIKLTDGKPSHHPHRTRFAQWKKERKS